MGVSSHLISKIKYSEFDELEEDGMLKGEAGIGNNSQEVVLDPLSTPRVDKMKDNVELVEDEGGFISSSFGYPSPKKSSGKKKIDELLVDLRLK